MARHLTILTGASRGMGLALAAQLLAAGHDLVCISRRPNATLDTRAAQAGVTCEQWAHDLSNAVPLAGRLEAWLAAQDASSFATATLINNAGVVPRIAPLGAIPAEELAGALRVDLEAPMVLASAFLRATQAWEAERRLLNISSGLGRRADASQAPYCAAKAGLDHFTRCIALEEARRPNGAKVCSLAPGVIDTDMQAHLRASDPGEFPEHAHFVALKERGQLMSPEAAAARVLAYLARPDFGAKPVADVRE